MSSCLGLYIESNLIKYAKVTKEKDLIKIDAFGIKFYDTIGEAISQIVSETFSYKVPISINLSEEMYNYFYFFNLLSKNDLKNAIDTEFDSYCQEKGYGRSALETRYSLTPNFQDNEKIKTIYISTNKTEINKIVQETDGNTVTGIYPLPMCMPNLINVKEKENVLIVNMEAKTTITTIIDQNIYNIDTIEEGMDTILYRISEKENSYSKAYEICKNTTIYTMQGKELMQESGNDYLEDIMPTLYTIVQKTKELVDKSLDKIDKIYITGSGCVISNIDLYFEEYFTNTKCEIIKPFFVTENIKINVKDYIEVNSAVALAMQGLDYGIKDINFKKNKITDKLPKIADLPKMLNAENLSKLTKLEFLKKKGKEQTSENKAETKEKKKLDLKINFSMKGQLDKLERWMLRTCAAIVAFIVIYSSIVIMLKNKTDEKISEVNKVLSDVNSQISKVNSDIQVLNNKTSNFQKMTNNLKSYTTIVESKLRTKNEIPLLLTQIMNIIPKEVTITSIENTKNTHIVINAQSEDYAALGFFKGRIITDGILSPSSVVSSSGVKQNGIVKISIEGDLP